MGQVWSGSAAAQELLANRKDKIRAAPGNGNKVCASVPNWMMFSIAVAKTQPRNVIRPWPGYAGTPTAAPADGRMQ